MSLIAVEGMEFYAYHGCFPEEKIVGTRFIADIYIKANTAKAEKNDDLEATINYAHVYELIKEEMNQSSDLIEHVARRILEHVASQYHQAEWIKIKIAKLNPPIGSKMKCVSVELTTDDIELYG